MRGVRVWVVYVVVVTVLGVAMSVGADTPQHLFYIARSNNANVVQFDALLGQNGALNHALPVRAYWIMNAEDGRREELTALERRMAYGFVARRRSSRSASLRLDAFPKREIQVISRHGRYQAWTRIADRWARLERIYVQLGKMAFIPSVSAVYLLGRCDGKVVSERLEPD